MYPLLFLPTVFAASCLTPEVRDGSRLLLGNLEDSKTFSPGDAVFFECENGMSVQPMAYQYVPTQTGQTLTFSHKRTCQEDGSWSGEPLVCGSIVDYPFLRTQSGTCSPMKGSCKKATSWEISFADFVDVDAVRVLPLPEYADEYVSLKNIKMTVEITNSTGQSTSCTFQGDSIRSSSCQFSGAVQVKLTSDVAFLFSQLSIISTTYRKFEGSSPYFSLQNAFVLSETKKNYEAAKEDCAQIGGELLESYVNKEWDQLENALEHQVSESQSKTKDPLKFQREPRWIGLSTKRGIWRYESGAPLSRTNQPNVTFNDRPTAGFSVTLADKNWGWKIARQNELNFYVCRLTSPRLACPYPGSPENGYIVNQKPNSFVAYKCLKGFELVGQARRLCNRVTGDFEPVLPKCVKWGF